MNITKNIIKIRHLQDFSCPSFTDLKKKQLTSDLPQLCWLITVTWWWISQIPAVRWLPPPTCLSGPWDTLSHYTDTHPHTQNQLSCKTAKVKTTTKVPQMDKTDWLTSIALSHQFIWSSTSLMLCFIFSGGRSLDWPTMAESHMKRSVFTLLTCAIRPQWLH